MKTRTTSWEQLSPDEAGQRIKDDEAFRNEHLVHLEAMVDSFTGAFYTAGGSDMENLDVAEEDAEKVLYAWISYVLDLVNHDDPRVKVTSLAGGVANDIAEAGARAANAWAKLTRHRDTAEEVNLDAMFTYGILAHGLTEHPDMFPSYLETLKFDDEPSLPEKIQIPEVRRLRQRDFALQRRARSWRSADYMHHREEWDFRDIKALSKKADEGWIKSEIDALTWEEEGDEKDVQKGRGEKKFQKVDVYWVWSRHDDMKEHPTEPDKAIGKENDYHGAMYCYARMGDDFRMIRKPFPFYGPEWGPYEQVGVFLVPNDPYRMGPCTAIWGLARAVNLAHNVIKTAMGTYRKGVFYDAANKKVAQAIIDNPNNVFIPAPGLQNVPVLNFEVGGVTEQMLAWHARLKMMLEEYMGFTQQQAGKTTGDTATASAIAEANSDQRLRFIKTQILNGHRGSMRTVLWYLLKTNEVVLSVGPNDADPREGEFFFGGKSGGENDIPFSQLQLDIEPYSMEGVAPGAMQQQTLQTAQMMQGIAQVLPQIPWLDWKKHLEEIGEATNRPDLAERIDWQGAMAASKIFYGQQLGLIGAQMSGEAELVPPGGQPTSAFGGGSAQPAAPGEGPDASAGGVMSEVSSGASGLGAKSQTPIGGA